jgi:hypothetical protein
MDTFEPFCRIGEMDGKLAQKSGYPVVEHPVSVVVSR